MITRDALRLLPVCAFLAIASVHTAYAQAGIHGTVIDAETGRGVAAVRVAATGNGASSEQLTDAEGRYVIRLSISGHFKITVSAIGYATITDTVTVAPNASESHIPDPGERDVARPHPG